jgi:hypothetical protein
MMIRNGGAKMRCEDWDPNMYMYLQGARLVLMDNDQVKKLDDVPGLRSFELLGNWEEVK